jgi:hypothetical protein
MLSFVMPQHNKAIILSDYAKCHGAIVYYLSWITCLSPSIGKLQQCNDTYYKGTWNNNSQHNKTHHNYTHYNNTQDYKVTLSKDCYNTVHHKAECHYSKLHYTKRHGTIVTHLS